jgi:hypothetical protein
VADPYRDALTLARAQYAEKQAERERIEAEIKALDLEIARLRNVIVALALALGEPSGLDEEQPTLKARGRQR